MKKLFLLNAAASVLSVVMMIPYACALTAYFDATARQPDMADTFNATLNGTLTVAIIGFAILGAVLVLDAVLGIIKCSGCGCGEKCKCEEKK